MPSVVSCHGMNENQYVCAGTLACLGLVLENGGEHPSEGEKVVDMEDVGLDPGEVKVDVGDLMNN